MEGNKTIGWKFPVCVNAETGAIQTIDFEMDIRQSIIILLNTIKSERFLHKSYGCCLNKFLYEPISYRLIKMIKLEITSTIRCFEQRITNVWAEVFHSSSQDTLLVIEIGYTIKQTGENQQLHYAVNLLE